MNRLGGTLIAIALIATACSDSGSDTTTTTTTTPPTSTATTTTLPMTTTLPPTTTTEPAEVFDGLVTGLSSAPCEGIGPAPELFDYEITFVRDGKLWAVAPEGGEARCLIAADDFPQQWNATGERLLTLGDSETDAKAVDVTGELALAVPEIGFEGTDWSRPTGTSVVGIDGQNRLVKYPIDGTEPTDLSFLARHHEVRYHPAGTHVLVTGVSDIGEYGIWQATNIGTEAELLIPAEEADVYSPTVRQDGLFMYFIADHGAEWHLHEVALFDGATNEFDASILVNSNEPLAALVVSPWNFNVAVAQGVCGSGMRTYLPFSDLTVMEDRETRPVGFTPDRFTMGEERRSMLLVAAWPDVCRADVAPDLYLVDYLNGGKAQLVVRGVDQFRLPGVRSDVGEVPPPPGEFDFSGFA